LAAPLLDGAFSDNFVAGASSVGGSAGAVEASSKRVNIFFDYFKWRG